MFKNLSVGIDVPILSDLSFVDWIMCVYRHGGFRKYIDVVLFYLINIHA